MAHWNSKMAHRNSKWPFELPPSGAMCPLIHVAFPITVYVVSLLLYFTFQRYVSHICDSTSMYRYKGGLTCQAPVPMTGRGLLYARPSTDMRPPFSHSYRRPVVQWIGINSSGLKRRPIISHHILVNSNSLHLQRLPNKLEMLTHVVFLCPHSDRSGIYCFCFICLYVCCQKLLYKFWIVRDTMYRLHIWYAYSTNDALSNDTKFDYLVTLTVTFVLKIAFCHLGIVFHITSCYACSLNDLWTYLSVSLQVHFEAYTKFISYQFFIISMTSHFCVAWEA